MKTKKLKIAKWFSAIIVVSAFSTMSLAIQSTPESQALIDELVKQISSTMIAVVDAEKKAGNDVNDLHIVLDIPGKHSPNLGLIMDINDKQGFRVLNVTPRSLADLLAIQQGDIITAINDVSIDNNDKKVVFAELENTLPGDIIKLDINRNGAKSRLEASVEGQYMPTIKIEIGESTVEQQQGDLLLAKSSNAAINEDEQNHKVVNATCGTISSFYQPPESKDLYAVSITHIGERKLLSTSKSYKLISGKHSIRLIEAIDDPYFKRYSRGRIRPKTLEIEIEENTTYYLAAKFIRNAKFKQKEGDYWEPVVWRVRENRPCEL